MVKERVNIVEVLRKAIWHTGLSPAQLAESTGVPKVVIDRFLRGFDMGMGSGSKIASFLGLELTAKIQSVARKTTKARKKPP